MNRVALYSIDELLAPYIMRDFNAVIRYYEDLECSECLLATTKLLLWLGGPARLVLGLARACCELGHMTYDHLEEAHQFYSQHCHRLPAHARRRRI